MNSPDNHTTFLHAQLSDIKKRGPTRVVIDRHGEAVAPRRALEKCIRCDVIFIRADGWSLGAPLQFSDVAENMWRDEWVGVTRAPFYTVEAY